MTRSKLSVIAMAILVMAWMPPPAEAGQPECSNERATIVGTDEDDVIQGTPGDDVIVARGGNDVIRTGRGQDSVCAGAGNDDVRTGTGFQDVVWAGTGDDVVHGGPGRNLLIAGPGDDRMYGSSHFDNFESPGRRTWDADTDLFVGRGRRDSFSADPGNDTFVGGKGADFMWFHNSPRGVIIDLPSGTATGDGKDTIRSMTEIIGSRHDDKIIGTNRDEFISSGGGDDFVRGRGGRDELFDAGGGDVLIGGIGRDSIGTAGCYGSSDGPTYCQTDEPVPDRLIGGRGHDVIGSGPGDDLVKGNDGDDRMTGGDGVDEMFGGEGDDHLHGGTAAGTAPDSDDGKVDSLDGGPGTDECTSPDDDEVNCEG